MRMAQETGSTLDPAISSEGINPNIIVQDEAVKVSVNRCLGRAGANTLDRY